MIIRSYYGIYPKKAKQVEHIQTKNRIFVKKPYSNKRR